ncbi:ACHA-like protein [Mya arenaria]|uniref:ACHA-like protein n=1 Tax=Mya arenaria TaxID=6604 RepID=A0ABY7EB25_MYAAR|nr:ACHA-like protein [Mya arenaria]
MRLTWNPAQYDGVRKLFLPADTIWLPDVGVINTVDGLISEQSTSHLGEVSHVGHVFMVSVMHVQTYCKMTLTNFPRDVYVCDIIVAKTLILESWHGETVVEQVPVSSDTDDVIPSRDGRSWELFGRAASAIIKLVSYKCCPGMLVILAEMMYVHSMFSYIPDSVDPPIIVKLAVANVLFASIALCVSLVVSHVTTTSGRQGKRLPPLFAMNEKEE